MSVTTLEGTVKDGKIVLSEDISLPEAARVYVVVPEPGRSPRILSPRIANPGEFPGFKREIFDIEDDKL